MTCSRGCCETQLAHYRTVSIAASACPSRDGGRYAKSINEKEKRWDKDMKAYRELRKNGLQPKQIDGSAELQTRAETKAEVESGLVMNPKQRKQYEAVTGDSS